MPTRDGLVTVPKQVRPRPTCSRHCDGRRFSEARDRARIRVVREIRREAACPPASGLRIGAAQELFRGRFAELGGSIWALAPDGELLLVAVPLESETASTLVSNPISSHHAAQPVDNGSRHSGVVPA